MEEKIKEKIQTIDIFIIIISLVLLISTEVSRSFGFTLGKVIVMLPTWLIEIAIVTSVIWGFKKRKTSWLACLSWGFIIIACLDMVLRLYEETL